MENGEVVDQRAKVERFFAEHHDDLCRQGVVVGAYRVRGGRRVGPYFRLTCRVAGRQVSVYLGVDEDLVSSVRERLSQLQRRRKTDRQIAGLRRSLRRQARLARKRTDAELKLLGLHRRGNEIRGWRSAEMFRSAAAPTLSSPIADVGTSVLVISEELSQCQ